ncbi:U32 family peptidase [Endozoicomonadaceae bacterium StTr2]
MQITLGTMPFFWKRDEVLAFYNKVAELPVERVYLGETVCSKRRALNLSDWLQLAEMLQAAGKEVVLSTLGLIEAESELSMLKRICENGRFTVEANDMAAVHYLSEQGLPFSCGPTMNIYNIHSLSLMAKLGMTHWVPPVEMSAEQLELLLAEAKQAGLDIKTEVFSWGFLPLAYSARCFTARARNTPKDSCGFVCGEYPKGLPAASQENDDVFTLNGIQTLSGRHCDLLGQWQQMRKIGVTGMRIAAELDAPEAIERLQGLMQGKQDPVLPVNACNGYWFGDAGMERVSLS